MLRCRPQGIKSQLIHEHGELFGHPKALDEPLIRVAPRVCWRALPTHVFQLNLPHVENRKVLDHETCSSLKNPTNRVTHTYSAGCRRRNSTKGMTTTHRAVTTIKQS